MCTPLALARPLCGLLEGAGVLVYITGAGPPLNTSPGGRVMPDIRDGREGHWARELWRTLEIEFISLKQSLLLIVKSGTLGDFFSTSTDINYLLLHRQSLINFSFVSHSLSSFPSFS